MSEENKITYNFFDSKSCDRLIRRFENIPEVEPQKKKKINYNKILFVLKLIFVFLLEIVLSWLAVWFINLFEWINALTWGGILSSLFFADASGLWIIIKPIVIMFPYIFVYFVSTRHMNFLFLEGKYRFLYLLLGIVIISLYDPNIKSYYPSFIYDALKYLQNNCYCYLLGSLDIANVKWSAEFTILDYITFDIYIMLSAIIYTFNKASTTR